MPKKTDSESIKARMEAAGLDVQTLAEVVGIPPARMQSIIDKGDATGDEQIRLRVLKQDLSARLNHLRNRRTLNLAIGERHDGVTGVPYGGSGSYVDQTGGQPK